MHPHAARNAQQKHISPGSVSPLLLLRSGFPIPRIPRPIPRILRFAAAAPIPRHSARSGLFRAIPRPVSFRAEPQIPRGAEFPVG